MQPPSNPSQSRGRSQGDSRPVPRPAARRPQRPGEAAAPAPTRADSPARADSAARAVSLRADTPLLLLSAAWLVALAVLYYFFVRTTWGQALDALAMHDAASIPFLTTIGRILNESALEVLILAMAVAAVLGMLRRRPWLALGCVAGAAGAMALTQLAKRYLLTRPNLGVGWVLPNSFPSGHGTATAVICLVALVSAPRAWRRYVAPVAVALPLLNGGAMMAMQWHRASDVFGAVAVSAFSLLVSLALVRGLRLRRLATLRAARGRGSADAAAGGAGDAAAARRSGSGASRNGIGLAASGGGPVRGGGRFFRWGRAGFAGGPEPGPQLRRLERRLWLTATGSVPVAGLALLVTRGFWGENSASFLRGDLSTASLGGGDAAAAVFVLALYAAISCAAVASTLLAARRLGA